MRNRIIRLGLIGVMVLVVAACQKSSQQTEGDDRYPWQISLLADGGSRIFGIQLGVSTVSEAKQLLGHAPEVALFENPGGELALELFYKEFTRAGLSGKLVLSLAATEGALQGFRQQAVKRQILESGVAQYRLDALALSQIETWRVAGMTYVPYANLEEKTIVGRFGEPAEKVRSQEKVQHWLYPDKGLDLIVNESGKEILQYVPPAEFEKLARPLRR